MEKLRYNAPLPAPVRCPLRPPLGGTRNPIKRLRQDEPPSILLLPLHGVAGSPPRRGAGRGASPGLHIHRSGLHIHGLAAEGQRDITGAAVEP